MKKLQFDEVEIEGFKNFREPATVNLSRIGLHFMCGDNQLFPELESNGNGKSTIWDAVCWCIYGRTLEGLRNPDIVPWGSTDPTTVTLRYRLDNTRHALCRRTQPNSLQLDGTEVASDSAFDGLNIEAFGHTVIHGQDRRMFFDLQPREKMDLLAEVLNLGRWEERSALADKRTKQIDGEIARLNADKETKTGVLVEIDRAMDAAKAKQDQWSEQLKIELAQIDKRLAETRKTLERVRQRHDEVKLKNDSAGTEAKALEREITQLEVYHDDANTKMLAKSAEYTTKDRARTTLRQQLRSLTNMDSTCPTCGQGIDQRVLRRLVNDKIDLLTEEMEAASGVFKALQSQERDLKDQLTTARNGFRTFRERERETQSTLTMLGPQVAELDTKIYHDVTERNQKRDNTNPYVAELKMWRARRAAMVQDCKELETKIKRYSVHAERARFWIKGFKEVRLYIIQEVLQQMQLLANAILEECGLIGWSLKYVSEQTTKAETIKPGIAILVQPPTVDKPIRWESFSGGEKQRLRLVGTQSLSEVLLNAAGLQINLQVFDEPTKGLSPRGINDLVDMLDEQARLNRRVIFLTDQHVIESAAFASIVTVVRDRDGSHVAA